MFKNLPISITFLVLTLGFSNSYAQNLGIVPFEVDEIAARGGHKGGHHGGGHRGGHGHHHHHRNHGHHHHHHWPHTHFHGHHWHPGHHHWDRHWNAINYWGPGHSWRHWYWYGGGLGSAAAAGYFYDPNYYWSTTTQVDLPPTTTDVTIPVEVTPVDDTTIQPNGTSTDQDSTTPQPTEINVQPR